MSESAKAVFLSYASQDAEAAKKICDALRAAGVEVWFDQSELVGGDAWDAKIRKQIKECALLIPIISANTQSRTEGYFRLEWRLADQRTHLMAKGRAFLLPVVIDGTKDAEAHVPDSFTEVQWTKAAGGAVLPAFVARVKKLLSGEQGALSTETKTNDSEPVIHRRGLSRLWWTLPIVGVAMVLLLVLQKGRKEPAPASSVVTSSASQPPPVAEFPHDPDLKRVYQLLYNLVDGIAEDFALMDDLVNPLLKARPNDPEVVTVAAELAQEFVTRGFDVSPARRAQAQRLTERAVQLAPDNPEALAALGYYLYSTRSQLSRAEELLRRAIKLKPGEPRFHCFLYGVLAARKKPEAEIEAFGAQLVARFPDYPMAAHLIAVHAEDTGDLAAAEAWTDKTLALAPLPWAILDKAQLMLEVHGDVPGFEHWLEQMPERQRTSAPLLNSYAVLATVTGRTGPARRVLEATADSWLVHGTYIFPKALLMGELEQIDGRTDLARRAFEAALDEVKARLAADPTDLRPIRAELWAQIGLGHRDEARAALRTNLEKRPRPYRWGLNFTWWTGALRACLLLDERTEALTLLKEATVEPTGRLLLRNLFRVDPKMAPFRDDPEIRLLLAEPVAAQVTEDGRQGAVAAAPAVDQKSVAVLAFTNLSDDKDNEYFSDGISEELLNVLAKVPGLKVTARTSSFSFKGKEVPVPEIARQLGVAYVVEGSVRKQGTKVRITAQLIKAADGFHVWSDTFTRELKDIFAVQDEIAGLIAKNLELKIGTGVPARREVNPEAHRLVLEGRHFWNLRTSDGFDRGEAAFRRAIALDPDYASAHAGLANVLATRLGYQAYEGATGLSYEMARTEAQRANALDPAEAEGNPALGLVLTNEGRLAEADGIYRTTIALNPSYALPHHWRSLVLELEGRIDEALVEIQRAVELDPLSGIAVGTQARMLQEAGRYQEAFAAYERAAAILPDRPTLSASQAFCLFKLNRRNEAVEWARKAVASTSRELRLVADADAIFVLRQAGHETEAAAHAERGLPLLGVQSYQRGAVLAAMGRLDEALPYLEHTPISMQYTFYWNPVWDAWREDPRFVRLLEKLGRVQEYQTARETAVRLSAGRNDAK